MTKDDEKRLTCRVCIKEADAKDKSYNIFEKYEDFLTPDASRDEILISDKLTACADVKIKIDDGLPNRICLSCLLELEDAYKFRRKCEQSDDILRIASMVNADTRYEEVAVKEESGNESERYISLDDATPLQSDNIKSMCEESPSVEDVKSDNKDERRTDVFIPTFDVQPASNISKVIKTTNLKLECIYCSRIFKSKGELRIHRKKEHTAKLPIACPFCKLQFKSLLAYLKHQKKRPKTCISLSNLRIEGEGITRHFFCKQCEYSSKNVKYSIQHLVVHTKNCHYKCDQCDKSFLRIVTLRGHKERTHKHYYGQKTCHICGMAFQGFTLYDSHMRRHREKNKAHCNICNKTFSSNSSLYTHKKTHTDLRSFACEKCPAKFRTSACLNCHKQVHSDNVHSCKVCGYTVKNPYIVKKHENEHNYGNVACRVCGKFFDSDSQLTLHMKRHEDRQHPCGHCDKTYTARKNLTEHLRKVHQIYVSSRSSDVKGLNVKKIKKINKTNLDK